MTPVALTPASLQALAPHENLIEVLISEAVLNPAAEVAPDASTFVAWDFFLHDSQATPVLPGHSPSYNCTVGQNAATCWHLAPDAHIGGAVPDSHKRHTPESVGHTPTWWHLVMCPSQLPTGWLMLVAAATKPTQVRYIVEADSFLLAYLTKQQLALEVFEARGWDVRALGVVHLPLAALLNDLEMGAGESWRRMCFDKDGGGVPASHYHLSVVRQAGEQAFERTVDTVFLC